MAECPECNTDTHVESTPNNWWCRRCKVRWPYEDINREEWSPNTFRNNYRDDD